MPRIRNTAAASPVRVMAAMARRSIFMETIYRDDPIPRSGQRTVNVVVSVVRLPATSSANNEIVYVPDGRPDPGNVH